MERLFLCLAGNPNSGKSSVARYFKENHGFAVVHPSDLIREYAGEHALRLDERQDYIKTHLRMVKEYGSDFVTQRTLGEPSSRVIVDGERIPRHIEALREAVGMGVVSFALWCPLEIRYQRSLKRREARDKPTLEEFARDEAREYQSTEPPYTSVLTVMQMADYFIDTSGSEAETIQAVEEVAKPLIARLG